MSIFYWNPRYSARSPITILKAKVYAYPNPYISSTGVAIPNTLKVFFPRSHLKTRQCSTLLTIHLPRGQAATLSEINNHFKNDREKRQVRDTTYSLI
jgi:hypothetical protein